MLNFIHIPDPLHPALVHFPLAFIMLGALCSLLALLPGKFFTRMTAFTLVLAAITAYFAHKTGGQAADAFLGKYPNAEYLLGEHAEWADKTYYWSIGVGILSVISMAALQSRRLSWLFRLVTMVGAFMLAYFAYETGLHGGKMVYEKALGGGVRTNQSEVKAIEPASEKAAAVEAAKE